MEFLELLASCVAGIVPVLLVNASGAFLNKLKIFEEITNKMFI